MDYDARLELVCGAETSILEKINFELSVYSPPPMIKSTAEQLGSYEPQDGGAGETHHDEL